MVKDIFDEKKFIAIKGLAAIMICLSHIISYDYPKYLIFLKDGSIWVGLFLFITGYGLMYSYNHKKNYLDNFFIKKIKKVYFPGCIAELFYIITYYLIFKDSFSLKDIILGILCFKNINTALWFVQLNLIINVVFYFIMNSNIKNKLKIFNIIYILVMFVSVVLDKFVGIDTWWYISLSCLILGFNAEKYYKSYINLYKSKLFFSFIFIITLILVFFINYSMVYKNNFLNINNNYFLIMLDIILNPIFTVFILKLFDLKYMNNKFFLILGKMSMYIYFYHNFFIRLCSTYFDFNNFMFCVVVLLFTLVFCLCIYFLKGKFRLWKKLVL